jgi:CarD family transcriptional regulator
MTLKSKKAVKKAVKKAKKTVSKKAPVKKAVPKKKTASKKVIKKVIKKAVQKAPKKTVHVQKPVHVKKPLHIKKHEHVRIHEPAKRYEPARKYEIKKNEPVKHETVKPKTKIEIPFRIGEFAVYPAHGVGKIENLEVKTIMGEKMEFLVISILDTGMNVLVPVTNLVNVGLRPVIKSAKVKDVYEVLKQKKRTVIGSTWNRRYREYMEKIKSGSVFEIAEVLRDLIVLKGDKDLSFGERKMLDTAKNLLIKELALAKGVNEKKIEAEIQKIFSEA